MKHDEWKVAAAQIFALMQPMTVPQKIGLTAVLAEHVLLRSREEVETLREEAVERHHQKPVNVEPA